MCKAKRANRHTAGPPCVAFSPQGSNEGLCHASTLAFLVWVAQRLLLDEDGILFENVPEFPFEVLVAICGSRWYLHKAIIRTPQWGHRCERDLIIVGV